VALQRGRQAYGMPELAVGSMGMNCVLLTENIIARFLEVTSLVIVCYRVVLAPRPVVYIAG
jgi:hypothetical protein